MVTTERGGNGLGRLARKRLLQLLEVENRVHVLLLRVLDPI